MNANEARTVSLQNSSKLDEAVFHRGISEINSLIRNEAEKGNFKVIFQTVLIESTVKVTFSERIKEHYEAKGFKVEIAPYFFAVRIIISWDIEGDEMY